MKFIIFLLCSALFLMVEVEVFEIVIPNFNPKKCKNSYKNCKCPNKSFKLYCISVKPFRAENPVCLLNTTDSNRILSCIQFSLSSIFSESVSYDSSSFSTSEEDNSSFDDDDDDDSFSFDLNLRDRNFLVVTTVINGKQSNDGSNEPLLVTTSSMVTTDKITTSSMVTTDKITTSSMVTTDKIPT